MLDIVAAGDGFDDLIFHSMRALPRAGHELKTTAFDRSPGGGAIITAVAAARLGLKASVISGLSSEATRALRLEGVAVRNLRRSKEPAAVTVALSTSRDRRLITYVGMNDRLPGRLRGALKGVRARHVHLAFAPMRCSQWVSIVRRLQQRNITTSWDFGWSPGLRRDRGFLRLVRTIDYAFFNRAEALLYAKRSTLTGAVGFWARAPRHVVIKLGSRGSLVIGRALGGRPIRERARRVSVVDTTGAGDSFNAGFLSARLRGGDLRAALRAGNEVGAQSVRRAGGFAGLRRRSRVS